MFRVGQKVVCVNTGRILATPGHDAHLFLTVGNEYQIRWVGECPFEPWRVVGPCVRVDGVVRPIDNGWIDMPFAAVRFRPVVERKTDISIFTRMLDGTKLPERV